MTTENEENEKEETPKEILCQIREQILDILTNFEENYQHFEQLLEIEIERMNNVLNQISYWLRNPHECPYYSFQLISWMEFIQDIQSLLIICCDISAEYDSKMEKELENYYSDAKFLLEQWYQDHIDNPYPSKEEKEEIAKITKMPMFKLNRWFYNRRARHRNAIARQELNHNMPPELAQADEF